MDQENSQKTYPDPLAGFEQKPIISIPVPGQTYLGRVVVELWESSDRDDASNLVFSADPTAGEWQVLVRRASDALSARIARQPQVFPGPQ